MDSKINILIVDDKPEKVLALEVVLQELEQNIVRAYSGREALRCLLNQSFAVILLDVNMPGMDGFETAALIRRRASTQGVPIIFVTAMDDETHSSRGYSMGAVDYIQTPVVGDVLKTKVAVFVDLFRKSEQIRLQAESLRRHAAQLHKLTAASLAIHSASTLERMFAVVTATAREISGARRAQSIFAGEQLAGPPSVFRSESDSPEVRQIDGYRPDSLGLHSAVRTANKPIRMSRAELEAHPGQGSDSGLWHAAGGWMAAPLLARDGRNLGLIEVSEKSTGDFTPDDEAVLVQLAQMGSIAIENTLYAAERQTNRIKNEFLSTLSHELRTPLNAILGWTQLLQMEQLSPDLAHGLEVIDRNARAQTKLIEDLLDVSRITTGKLVLTLRPTVIGPVILAAADAVRPSIEAKRIALDCDLSAAEMEAVVDGDSDRLQQVFWNLLSNAVKFTPESGRIEVRLERQENSIQLRVTDTGRGISRAFLPYVFDRFRQADSSSTRSQGGLGIGLTIVRHIVELHGGKVSADSDGDGQGATFTVTLPLASMKASSWPSAAAEDREAFHDFSADLTGLHILVVDDEADAREVVAATLQRSGASITAVASVDEALAVVARSRPDLVISDIAMPDKDGFDLIRLLRELPAEMGQTPALALTAYAREEDQARALAAGFQFHLAKPVNPGALLRAITQLNLPGYSGAPATIARIEPATAGEYRAPQSLSS
ncbi:MAG TPA: response regulator [Tepidisphaeraceae bacterium]|jgi:signal transduction histidine kinase/DNA-binding response OmpR family regulator|nr:response regulator [Tepidisphaeraceae bacterium]